MKKNSTIEKKIARYSAFAGTVLAAGSAQAQLQYYDFVPDLVFNNATGGLDLTLDGNADFVFADTLLDATSSVWLAAVIPVGTHGVMGSVAGNYEYPFKLNLNDPIGSTGSWINGGSGIQGSMVLMYGSTPYGGASAWQGGATDKYLGVRLDLGSGSYSYGWFRCDLTANGQTLTIKDMGFNTTPNASINAGQYNVSVSENIAGKVNVVNQNNIINITTTEVFTNGNVTVTNLNGQVVANQAINSSASVDLTNIAAGIYVINIAFNEGVYTQKIYIK